jgi:hypothetical protein
MGKLSGWNPGILPKSGSLLQSFPNVLGNVGRNSCLLTELQQSLLPEDVLARFIAFPEGKVSPCLKKTKMIEG